MSLKINHFISPFLMCSQQFLIVINSTYIPSPQLRCISTFASVAPFIPNYVTLKWKVRRQRPNDTPFNSTLRRCLPWRKMHFITMVTISKMLRRGSHSVYIYIYIVAMPGIDGTFPPKLRKMGVMWFVVTTRHKENGQLSEQWVQVTMGHAWPYLLIWTELKLYFV